MQVYAAAFLIRHGFFYTAMKIAFEEIALLKIILEEMRTLVQHTKYGALLLMVVMYSAVAGGIDEWHPHGATDP